MTAPRLLLIQIDGLSAGRLRAALAAGRMPHLARLSMEGSGLRALAGATPPAAANFQSRLLYGRCAAEVVPGATWFERESGRIRCTGAAADVSRFEALVVAGAKPPPPLVAAQGGATARAHVAALVDRGRRALLTLARQLLPARWAFRRRFVALLAKGVVQGPRELARAGQDMVRHVRRVGNTQKEWGHLALRTLNAAFFEEYVTSYAVADMRQGAPIVYLDFHAYDQTAQRRGPDDAAALAHLERIDCRIGSLADAARKHGYEVVVCSDHGQTEAVPFTRVVGTPLPVVVFGACTTKTVDARFRAIARALHERRERSAQARRWAGPLGALPAAYAQLGAGRAARLLERDYDLPASELAVVVDGAVAHVYVGRTPEGVTLEEIKARFPRLLSTLGNSPGVGLLVARRTAAGPLVIWRGLRAALDDQRALEKLEPFRALGVARGQRLIGRTVRAKTAGDLILYGAWARAGTVSFDDKLGSHGGLHPEELDLFLVHPPELALHAGPIGFDPADLNAALRARYRR